MCNLFLNRKIILCTLYLVCLKFGHVLNNGIAKHIHFYKNVNRDEKKRKNLYRQPLYILKYKIYNKKKKFKLNNWYNCDKKRPERKLEPYELNIRNDKKFPKYSKKPVSPSSNLNNFSPFKNIINSFQPVDHNIKNKLREEGFQFESERKETNMFPSLDEIIKNGDPSTNMHFYRRKKLKSLLYSDPLKFVKGRKVVEKYNRSVPEEKRLNYDMFRCDIFYVHSDGTIMNIEEDRPPFDKKLEESDRYKEPRYIISTAPGHAKENNLKIGDKFPIINEENKKKIFDNHFARPKKMREPLILPDGRKIP